MKLRHVSALALSLLVGAAIARGQSATGPLSWPRAAQDELDAELAATWATARPPFEDLLRNDVKAESGTTHGQLTVDSLDLPSHDFSSPPAITLAPIVTNGAYSGERLHVDLPKAGTGWSFTIAGRLSYRIDKKILFIHVKKTITEDVTLEVTGLHASEEIDLDTHDPTLPVCARTGPTKLDYTLKVKTNSLLVNLILAIARPWLDRTLRSRVDQALASIDLKVAPLVGLPGTPWGANAPAHGLFGQQPDLEKCALGYDDDIQRWHLPWNTILSAVFSDPTYGQGTVVSYDEHGDSAIWTGHYLAGEAFRSAVTKDPTAAKNAARVLSGITDLLDAETPGGGHLSRCVIPMSDPSAAQMLATNPTVFQTTLHGLPYVAHDHISRDQYLGVVHGLGCAYDFLDDPAQRRVAGDLICRIVDYLIANHWVAMEHDGKTVSAPFIQSPEKMVAFTALAAHVDPRFQAERDRVAPLVYISWLGTWTSLLDPLDGYYGWNLGNGARYHAMRLETDPSRFMALERSHAIERRGIGHHENAYFQTVDVAVDPTLSTSLSPLITDELRRFATRPRRQFPSALSTDPTVEKADYSVPLSFQKSASGSSGSLVPLTVRLAKYVVPVEKRCSTDFLWQRNPFDIDGNGDPHEQAPGVDMVLPYWMARFYKLVP
jgi:hypothetical protein